MLAYNRYMHVDFVYSILECTLLLYNIRRFFLQELFFVLQFFVIAHAK